MKPRKAPAYWATRVMLAAAFLSAAAIALLWLSAPESMGPPLHDDGFGWVRPVTIAVGVALWLVGVIWMLRTFRGPRDEPPQWRYRGR